MTTLAAAAVLVVPKVCAAEGDRWLTNCARSGHGTKLAVARVGHKMLATIPDSCRDNLTFFQLVHAQMGQKQALAGMQIV